MLLRNYDNLMLAKRMFITTTNQKVSTDTTTFGDGHINAHYYNTTGMGGNCSICHSTSWTYAPMSYFVEQDVGAHTSSGCSILWCGTGDTPVTYDDTNLASSCSSSQITSVSGSAVITKEYNETDNSWVFTYSRVLSAKETLTIKEIGVFSGYFYATSYRETALVYRKVLDTPIEVQAGDLVKLSLTMTYSANPNKPADYNASATLVE